MIKIVMIMPIKIVMIMHIINDDQNCNDHAIINDNDQNCNDHAHYKGWSKL